MLTRSFFVSVRAVLSSQPLNLRTLILHLSHHLFTLLPSPLFPSPTPSSTSNLLNLPTKLSQQNPTKEALNCLRVLGRILAVVFEVDAEELPSRSSSPVDGEAGAAELGKDFAWNILWRRMQVPPMEKTNGEANHHDAEDAEDGAEQFELGEHSDGEDEVSEWKDATSRSRATSSKNKTPKSPQKASEDPLTNATDKLTLTVEDMDRDDTLPSLADRLFSCTVDLLFCAGFTIPEGVRTGEHAGDKINVGRLALIHVLPLADAVLLQVRDLGERSRFNSQYRLKPHPRSPQDRSNEVPSRSSVFDDIHASTQIALLYESTATISHSLT